MTPTPRSKPTPTRKGTKPEAARVPVANRAALRTWFTDHHARGSGVWIVYERPTTVSKGPGGAASLDESAIIDEALCFGWIDSQSKKLDERRSMLYVSPRKPKGTWSARNKARVEALEASGLMTPHGRATVDAAKADGSWESLDGVASLSIPSDLAAALKALDKARARFDAFPPGARRAMLAWIGAAKRDETRAKRVAQTAQAAAKGLRAGPAAQ